MPKPKAKPSPTQKARATDIAKKLIKAMRDESKNSTYAHVISYGGNPFEYGMRTEEQILADELLRLKLI